MKNRLSKQLWLMVIPLAFIILILDQATKFYTEACFPIPHNYHVLRGVDYDPVVVAENYKEPIFVFGNKKILSYTFDHIINQGAAWGILQGKMGPLSIVSFVVFIFLIWYYRKFTEGYLERDIAYGLLQGGILGNFIDRVGSFGRPGVVDFLDFYIFNYNFPAFNIADAAICIGVFTYCISTFVRPDKKKEKSKTTETTEALEASG